MLLGQVAERLVLIGDPGQIPPVVSVDVLRRETSWRPPHIAAPRVILSDQRLRPEQWQLPATGVCPTMQRHWFGNSTILSLARLPSLVSAHSCYRQERRR
jgi:hypothetical protein